MAQQNLFRSGQNLRWWPDADSVGAPDDVLLRATNLVPDPDGLLALRMGSSTVYQNLIGASARVHTLLTRMLVDGVSYRFAGVDDKVFRNGEDFGITFGGTSGADIVMGDDAYQAFFARGSTKKKFDGSHLHNWAIPAPEFAPTLAAVTAITDGVATFNTAESPAFTVNEGTGSFVLGQDGTTANGALKLIPAAGSGRASATKTYAAAQDFFDIKGTSGGDTDLFDIYVWLEEPRKVDKITIMFGLENSADPYKNDYYYFDFNIKDADTVNIKDAASNASSAYGISNARVLSPLAPEDVTNVKSPENVGDILRRLGRFAGPRSRERTDAQQASPAWTHLSVTRGQFNRIGGTAGRDWSTVWGFKVVYTALPGSTESIYFDDAVWTGGGNRSLTGRFRVGLRAVRNFGNGIYYEKSPISPISDDIVLSQQSLQVTVGGATLTGLDPQVNELWVYLYGGFLDTYYRVAVTAVKVQLGMTIDELTNPAGSDFNAAAERTRLSTHGFSIAAGAVPSSDLVFTIRKSELEALIENEVLVPGIQGPPDDLVAIAGPWNRRMFGLDSEGYLHVSQQNDPSAFSLYHSVFCGDLRQYGDPLWAVCTNSGVYIGMTKDVIRMEGSGDESSDRVTIDLYPQPLGLGNPPVDAMVQTDGNAIIYRSSDGLMLLVGSSVTPLPVAGTNLLWRGQARHGISALNTATGRFRIASDNHIVFALMPEGTDTDPTAIWRYDLNGDPKQWARTPYPFTPLSIFKDPTGPLLVGTTDGRVVEIEVGTQDDDEDIEVDLLAPITDGRMPHNRKDPADLQIHCDTDSDVGSFKVYADGGASAGLTVAFSTAGPNVFRANAQALGRFLKAQIGITGRFSKFLLHAFNLTFRPLPQQVMVLDSGYILPDGGKDLAWITDLVLDTDAAVATDLYVDLYKDDTLFTTLTVVIGARRSTYPIPVPRGFKARRPRVVFRASAADGAGNVGFEPYGVAVRRRGTGTFTELPIQVLPPAGGGGAE
jgi:hypothetical protein